MPINFLSPTTNTHIKMWKKERRDGGMFLN